MVKRLMDVVVGLILGLATLPAVLALAVCSSMSFRAWPFFVQDRVGRGGTTVRLVKIRSLPVDTGEAVDKYSLDPSHNTAYGRFIRRSHLDELPQFWSVVVGTMSLVGPRPEMQHLDRRFTAEHREARQPFRPGCLGLWQVGEHNHLLMYEHPEYDRAYAANQSTMLDLYIMWRTVVVAFGGRRVSLGDMPRRLLALEPDAVRVVEPSAPAIEVAP